MTARCPHCAGRIDGISAAGPGLHTVAHCGHFVDRTPLKEVLAPTSPRDAPTSRERRALVRERDGERYITDGGRP